MTNISDEQLNAYLDDELSAAERARIDAALEGDPQLQARLAELGQINELLTDAYAPIIEEPVPDHIAALVRNARTPESNVVQLRPATRAPSRWAPMALAASIALVLGFTLLPTSGPKQSNRLAANQIIERGSALDGALTRLSSGRTEALDEGSVEVVLTFASADQGWCREFVATSPDQGATRAVACRALDRWQVVAADRVVDGVADGTFSLAGDSADGSGVEAFIDEQMSGDILDAGAEERLLSNGWARSLPR